MHIINIQTMLTSVNRVTRPAYSLGHEIRDNCSDYDAVTAALHRGQSNKEISAEQLARLRAVSSLHVPAGWSWVPWPAMPRHSKAPLGLNS